jgi:hypothetical protein
MQSVANRRTFVRHMVVGVPVIAATTSLPATLGGASRHEVTTSSSTIETIARDLGRLHNEMQRRGAKPGDLTAFAAHMRALATYQVESKRDLELVRNIKAVIARDGRQSIIDHTPDPEMMRRELAGLGFDIRTPPVGVINADRRADALDRLARGGLAPAYFETLLAADEDFTEAAAFYLMTGGSALTEACKSLRDMQTTLEAIAGVMCTMAVILPPTVVDCFAASSTLATIKLLMLLIGC